MSEITKIDENPLETFQKKVTDKIRQDIGQMLPEEVVKALFQKAIEEEFFEPRIEWTGYNNNTRVDKPSWFVEAISKEAKSLIEAHVKEFFESKKPEISEEIKKFLNDQNLLVSVMQFMTYYTQDQIRNALNQQRY